VNGVRTVDLLEEHIDLILKILTQRNADLTDLLKQQGFEPETIQDMELEQRDINDVIRELVHYSRLKTNG
jgi:metal-dependent HD superfamily phosphatase/phosphodiesterase